MNKHYSQGFSLLEVLIAVVVIGVGIIGVAGMQIIGLRHTHSSYLLTMANTLGNDMAERMRANMTRYDEQAWASAVAASLPNGVGTLTRNAGQGTFTIQITWDERQNGSEGVSTKTYVMTFRP